MSRTRILIALGAGLALLVLVGWNAHRQHLVGRCLDSGGLWNGPRSSCEPDPHRITIQRDLYRS